MEVTPNLFDISYRALQERRGVCEYVEGSRMWFRIFTDARGSVASELGFGMMVVGILVIGGLFAMAQVEGVSFQVLLSQIHNGHNTR